jgi:Domain of unknown function (DUF4279)
MKYIDDYLTCARTHATVCIYGDSLDPETVTRDLGIQPTDAHRRGEIRNGDRRRPLVYRTGGWFLESRMVVSSRDLRQHIDWLLDQLGGKGDVLRRIRDSEHTTIISCFWESAHGYGGPMLWPEQIARLAALGLELWFDVYPAFSEDDPTAREISAARRRLEQIKKLGNVAGNSTVTLDANGDVCRAADGKLIGNLREPI